MRIQPWHKWNPPAGLAVSLSGSGSINVEEPQDSGEVSALEADWQTRIAGPGVVWYHDFRDEAEVDAFRWTAGYSGGNDPNANGSDADLVRQLTTDGITGGSCLDYTYPAGSSPNSSYWWRPFAPMNTGSGKASNDPAASGTLTVRSWSPTDGGSELSNFAQGWYGHPDSDDANFDGHDFYLQIRAKMDPRRITGGNDTHTVGKFIWLTTAEGAQSLSNAEHVIWSYGNGGNDGTKNYFRVYALGVNGIGSFDPLDQEEAGSRIQPGSDSATDWSWSGGWDTVLIHLSPGVQNTTSGDDATHLEVWAAQEGETAYTKIWDQVYGLSAFEARSGLQALILGGFNNNNDFSQEFYHRFDQVIFSKDYIPVPQSGVMPSWYPAVGEVVEIDSGTTIGSAARADGANSYAGTDPDDLAAPWSGGAMLYVGGQPYLVVAGGGHGDGAYNGLVKFGPLYGAGSDSPTWSVFLSGSDTGDVQNGPTYADGRLAAAHTYNNVVGAGERYYQLSTDAYYSVGAASNEAAYYTPNGQVDIPSFTRSAFYGASGHFNGRLFWAGGGSQFDRLKVYDISTNTWTEEPNGTVAFNNYVSGAIDTNRGGFLVIAGSPTGGATGGAYWDLSDFGRDTGINRPSGYHNSIIFDPERDAFVSVVSGSLTVRELDAADLASSSGPSWSDRTFTGDTPASGVSAGTYGRFQYVPQLKGYILAPSSESSVYFYRSA